uniref:DRBM domain-containing protein n=1 Tax=Tetraselmis sp. GSL018 TaxID=582737 RepID=A0A061RIE0_9CHLO
MSSLEPVRNSVLFPQVNGISSTRFNACEFVGEDSTKKGAEHLAAWKAMDALCAAGLCKVN